MVQAVLSSKGQVTIPNKVRSALGIGTGDRIEFVETEDGSFAIVAATKSVKSLKGMINAATSPVSIEEMNAAIAARGAAAR
jgi:antitoxin PrlF